MNDEYIPTNWLDEAKLNVDEFDDIKKAKVFALIAIAEQLQELKWLLKKSTNKNGAFEVEVVKTVVTINENQL